MPQNHRLQIQRFELKYLVPDSLTPAIRDFAQKYLVPDEFCSGSPNLSYAVHSIYLDSKDLKTYYWALNDNDVRFKLRVRYYDAEPTSLVFFETKRRINSCVRKQRCAVRRETASKLVNGRLNSATDLPSNDSESLKNFHTFCTLKDMLEAQPMAQVTYSREAWVSPRDDSVRVTFDRQISCQPRLQMQLRTSVENPRYPFDRLTMLELKFTDRYPDWFRTLVEKFDLMECGGAKYAAGVELCGEEHFTAGAFVSGL